MTSRGLVLLSSALVAGAAPTASRSATGAEEEYSFKAAIQIHGDDESKTLAVVDGDVRLLGWRQRQQVPDGAKVETVSSEQVTLSWKITREARGCTIRVADETKFRGWYLSYDRHAPAKGVFLSQRPNAGSYWEIDRLHAGTGKDSTPIRAQALGHDWQLDYDKGGATYRRDKPEGLFHSLYAPKLTEGRGARFLIDDFGK